MAVVQQQPEGVQTGAVWRTLRDREGSWENGIDRLSEKVDYLGKKIMASQMDKRRKIKIRYTKNHENKTYHQILNTC